MLVETFFKFQYWLAGVGRSVIPFDAEPIRFECSLTVKADPALNLAAISLSAAAVQSQAGSCPTGSKRDASRRGIGIDQYPAVPRPCIGYSLKRLVPVNVTVLRLIDKCPR